MRYYTLAFSIVVHLTIVLMVVIVPLVATDVLPEPRRAVEYIQVSPVRPPQPPAPPRQSTDRIVRNLTADAAPVEVPNAIGPDSGLDRPIEDVAFGDDVGTIGGVDVGERLAIVDPVPPPPPPAPKAPMRVGGLISQPQKVRAVAPVYPAIARAARIEGMVILDAVIGTDGRVSQVRLLRSIPLLDQAAMDAVRQWVFTPTLLNGEPVPVVMTVTVAFTLRP
jgi:protein TonB